MKVEAAAATQKEVAPKRKYLHQIIPARASPSAHAPRTYHARDAHHACASTPQDALDNCSSACSGFDAEGMAADAADNARRWDEGVATAVRLERGGGVAKRELLEDAEEQRSERSNFWIEICRAENASVRRGLRRAGVGVRGLPRRGGGPGRGDAAGAAGADDSV